METANIKYDGSLSPFFVQKTQLPHSCAFGGATTISQFIYLVCGYDGFSNHSSKQVLSAQILDPLAVPVLDLSLEFNLSYAGVASGRYVYKVSAVYPSSYARNPGGEGLPSEGLTVIVPQISGLLLIITWGPVPGASGYNVYRSVSPGSTQMGLLGSTSNFYFVDDGNITVVKTTTPLPQGSLGTWHSVGSLNIPRSFTAISSVPDSLSPTRFYLHVGGKYASFRYLLI